MILITIIISMLTLANTCSTNNCASCINQNQNTFYCYACNIGYELTENGLCLQNNLVPNCALYSSSSICIECQPAFRLQWNNCNRFVDGCLIQKNNKCAQCVGESYLDINGSCVVKYLNCKTINQNGQCSGCLSKYRLVNGTCIFQDVNCLLVDNNTGLCILCSVSSRLIGEYCVPRTNASLLQNCYLVSSITANVTCSYCKAGYGVYFGLCKAFQYISINNNLSSTNCSVAYQEGFLLSCLNISMASCLTVDFGLRKCTICESGYYLQNNTCVSITNKFCLTFDSLNVFCVACKLNFYLKSGICNPFPLFCISFSNGCVSCEKGFRLIQGVCRDPNCLQVNSITLYCQVCSLNYKNVLGICKFKDPNCQQYDSFGNCIQCIYGFSVRNLTQICTYQDVNCINIDNITGNCNMCKPFYYFNQQVQLCIPLSSNCQQADQSGRCSQCFNQYVLVSNYQCLFLPKLNNCNMINSANYSQCLLCVEGYYADQNGVCQKLPIFCTQYDSPSNTCLQCSDSGVMRSGVCVDKNCQIFDLQGSCLACLTSYQFNSFGQCQFQNKDPYCKVFAYGICKSCTQRYYFNFQFVCTAISPFCNTYDTNSGDCLSCYNGYTLSNGQCNNANLYYSLMGSTDVLGPSSACKTYNSQGNCIECAANYVTVPINDTKGGNVVNCVGQSSLITSSFCIHSDTNGQCLQCVYRMYVDSTGACANVDENCDIYNETTGYCNSCYTGYTYKLNSTTAELKCVIVNNNDPNCQNMSNSSGCIKCYSGYFYSVQNLKCTQLNQLCSTSNLTNGDCLGCYNGYELQSGRCIVSNISYSRDNSPTNNIDKTLTLSGCLLTNLTSLLCTSCQWGYALINGICYQKDLNCQTFQSVNSLSCLKCYDGFKPFGSNSEQCVLSTLIINNCLKYSSTISCVLCQNGYILSANLNGLSPPYTCNIIDTNCAAYNSITNSCSKCVEGTVIQDRTCINPIYGVDPNCIYYSNKLCTNCRSGWVLSGYICSQS